jgi:hypothetical protein
VCISWTNKEFEIINAQYNLKFSDGCFHMVVEQYAVKGEKFILSIVSSETVQEAIHHCLHTAEIKFYCEDLHTPRIVAKMHHSGWGFCTEMNLMHRFY